jgi:hypothetical protein
LPSRTGDWGDRVFVSPALVYRVVEAREETLVVERE